MQVLIPVGCSNGTWNSSHADGCPARQAMIKSSYMAATRCNPHPSAGPTTPGSSAVVGLGAIPIRTHDQ